MRKLFLTSGLVLCVVGNAIATTDIPATVTNNTLDDGCTDTYLGTYSGSASLQAKWETNVSGAITLNSNRWVTNNDEGASSIASTPAAPTPLYSVYDVGIFSDSTYAANRDTTHTISELTTAPVMTGYTFAGFYTEKATGGTKVINADKSFVSGAENVISASGGTATWYARWTPKNYKITFAKNTVDVNNKALVATPSGTTGDSNNQQTYAYDSTANLATNGYSVAGYTFGGWSSNKTLTTVAGTGAADYSAGQSITYKYDGNDAVLTAKWNPNISGAITLNSTVYPSNNRSATALYSTSTTPEAVTAAATTTVYTKYNTGLYTNSTATTATTAANLKPSKAGYKFGGFYSSDGSSQYIDSAGAVTTAGTRAITGSGTGGEWFANWSPIEYSITYKPGTAGARPVSGSNVVKPVYYDATTYKDSGALNTLAANTFSITGYTFDKWSSDHNVSTGSATSYTYEAATGLAKYKVVGNTEMTALWTPNCSGSVTLDSKRYTSAADEDGSAATSNGSPTPLHVKYDNGLYSDSSCTSTTGLTNGKITIPTLTGYDFGGFYTTKAGSGDQMIDSTGAITATAKTALPTSSNTATWWAKWTAKTITNGLQYTCGTAPTVSGLTIATTGYAPASVNTTYDSSYTLSTGPSTCALTGDRGGYHFGGWICTVNPETGSSYATYNSSYANNAWTVSKTVNKWKATSAVNCAAKWTGNTYTVSYATGTAGSRTTGFSGTMNSQDVSFGDAYGIPENAFSITGYTFKEWSGNYSNDTGEQVATKYASDYSFTPYKIAHNLQLTAQWTANNYTITYKAGDHGTGSDAKYTGVANGGLTYDAAWTTKTFAQTGLQEVAGYTFSRWDTAAAGNGTSYSANAAQSVWTTDGGLTLYAIYTPNNYSITFDCGTKPSGASTSIVTGTAIASISVTYTQSFTAPNTVTPTAAQCKLDGYHFNGWSCENSINPNGTNGSGGTAYNVVGNTACHATWTANKIDLTWQYGNGSANTIGTCNYDGSITIPSAPTKTGYTFKGWTISNN